MPAHSNPQEALLSGTITDAGGGGVGSVQVTARLEGSPNSQIWSAVSTATGEYSLVIPPGGYHVQFIRNLTRTARNAIEDYKRRSSHGTRSAASG